MGSVWLAEDVELGRRVAVKVLGPDADRARFEREARAVAALADPNICQLYDFGEDTPRGLVDRHVLRRRPPHPLDLRDLFEDQAQGLVDRE